MNNSDLPENCSYCGDSLRVSEWHPIKSTVDEDGTFRVHAFCDRECKERWEEERDFVRGGQVAEDRDFARSGQGTDDGDPVGSGGTVDEP